MRIAYLTLAAALFAGYASAAVTAPGNVVKVYDQKTNMVRYAYLKPAPSEFVGTSAKVKAKPKAGAAWYPYGHP